MSISKNHNKFSETKLIELISNIHLLQLTNQGYVDLRDLHEYLNMKSPFCYWVKYKMKQKNIDRNKYEIIKPDFARKRNARFDYQVPPTLACLFIENQNTKEKYFAYKYLSDEKFKKDIHKYILELEIEQSIDKTPKNSIVEITKDTIFSMQNDIADLNKRLDLFIKESQEKKVTNDNSNFNLKSKIKELAIAYAKSNSMHKFSVYNKIYNAFDKAYNIDLVQIAKESIVKSPMDIIEEMEILEEFWQVTIDTLTRVETCPS